MKDLKEMAEKKSRQKYAELLCDFMFKRVFGSESSKDVLIKFLNMILEDHEVMTDVLRFVFLELGRFNKRIWELENMGDYQNIINTAVEEAEIRGHAAGLEEGKTETIKKLITAGIPTSAIADPWELQ